MKKYFTTHLEAIQWISDHAKNESHFAVLREELAFNHIYTEEYFVHTVLLEEDVEWLDSQSVTVLPTQTAYDGIDTWAV